MTVQTQTAARSASVSQLKITQADHAYARDLQNAIDADAKLASKQLRAAAQPQEWKLVPMRECPTPGDLLDCSNPENAVAYWRAHITSHPFYNPECECAVALLLNSRRRVKGHCLISIGSVDTVQVYPREVFRAAVIASAAAIVVMHNHPSGDPAPSDGDIECACQLDCAAEHLRIALVDHVIVGNPGWCSLRRHTVSEAQCTRISTGLLFKYGPPHNWPPAFNSFKRHQAVAA